MSLNNTVKILALVAATLVVSGIFFLTFKGISSTGKIDYCYITSHTHSFPQTYKLYGFRSWRIDISMGTYLTFEEAVKNAQSINCKIEVN